MVVVGNHVLVVFVEDRYDLGDSQYFGSYKRSWGSSLFLFFVEPSLMVIISLCLDVIHIAGGSLISTNKDSHVNWEA